MRIIALGDFSGMRPISMQDHSGIVYIDGMSLLLVISRYVIEDLDQAGIRGKAKAGELKELRHLTGQC